MAENKLGRSIQMLRESNMMTRDDFAQRIGVLRRTVVDWEEGRVIPTAEQLMDISKFFSVDPRALVDAPLEGVEEAAPEKSAPAGGKRMVKGVVALALALVAISGAMTLIRGLSANTDDPAVSTSDEVEEVVPLPDSLALTTLKTALWDLDGDGEKEVVALEGEVLFVKGGAAYGLAEALPKGQTLTPQDGVFVLKNEAGESRIYSVLRDGALWPAG